MTNFYCVWIEYLSKGMISGEMLYIYIYIYIYIYLSDLFLLLGDNKASNADGTIPYAMKENALQVLKEIEDKAACAFWFPADYFKTNPKKYHFLLKSNKQVDLNLDDLII